MENIAYDVGQYNHILLPALCKPHYDYKDTIITRPIHGGDVPDGGTSTSPTTPQEPLDLRREDHRLMTLNNWPPHSFMDKAKAARTGFYYYGDRDRVRCYFCKIELHSWKEGDDIVADHGRWSPNCLLLAGVPCGNVPLSRDECGVRDGRGPAHPAFMTYQSRLATFHAWPSHMKQTPQELADAGFFYTGLEDQTLCYHCGGGLKDWEEDDKPWEQHATWFSRCPYVLAVKGDQYAKSARPSASDTASSSSSSSEAVTVVPQPQPQSVSIDSVSSDASVATAEEDSKMCKICFGEERNVCFVPCGHVVACPKCAMSVLTCPICRKPFTSTMRLYYS